ncbi:hypothetical protein ACHAPO_007842 [Fusarium lateritium]
MSSVTDTPAPAASMDVDQMDVDSSIKPSTANNATTIDDDDDDDDPVTATYNVFINPSLPLGRRLLVLQHPNRTDESPRPPPTELRVKAQAGMVEVDVPLDNTVAYDREKGLKWGKTLNASMATKNGGSHGLAGGFGFGTVQARGGRKKAEEDDEAVDWAEAVRQDKVLRTQTLGGQYPEYKEVQHMVGVFQGKDLHLTPVSSLVHLRPQLHHIDATVQQERQAAATKDSAPTTTGGTARAIHMTVKATGDGETVTTETMADRLRSVQTEHWRTMHYTDENEEAAWEVYNESLFLRRTQDDEAEEKADDADDADEKEQALEESVPKFARRWNDNDLLYAVSGIERPKTPELVVKEEPKPAPSKQAEQPVPGSEEARKPKLRPRGGAAAGGVARRGGKPRAAASKTVNIDE